MVKFCIDRMIDGRAYPNLARWQAQPYTPQWRQFSAHWPYSEPVHFFEYLDAHDIPYQLVSWSQADRSTLYPISLSYFDFDVDWFSILPVMIKEKLRSKSLTLWFFYSEGDNPYRIRDHLYMQFQKYDIDTNLLKFTSANSAAASIPRFSHFVDDECLFWLRNQDQPVPCHDGPRARYFTALVRTHKWWRATTMARLWSQQIHEHSYFSYNTGITVADQEQDNPIEVDNFVGLRDLMHRFMQCGVFQADGLNSDQHNLYATTVREHFADSYLNIVLETHMDVDQSDGVFLTEKTFKPIKNGQPFVILGAPGSLRQLRNMGYRTFDHVLDNRYDQITNTTQRWDMACTLIETLRNQDLHTVYQQCRDDCVWNQNLFMASKQQRLNNLLQTLTQ